MFTLISLLCCVMLTNLAFAASFPDVDDFHVHNGAVEYLKSKGVISGYPDGTFQPDKTINRAEALKMVMLSVATETDSTQVIDFSDVLVDDWFYEYVRKAVEIGIVEGYDDGTFKPANNINVAESIKIILVAFGEEPADEVTKQPYADVEVTDWYAAFAEYGRTKQFVWPLDDGKLHADRDITRGEFAEIIYRVMYTTEKDLDAFPISTDWPTYAHPEDKYVMKYPFGWEMIIAGDQRIFWKQDEANDQVSWARTYPDSATVVIARDDNEKGVSLADYLKGIEYPADAIAQEMTLNGYPFASVSMLNEGITDYYVQLTDNSILVIYSQVGSGDNKTYLTDQVRYLVGSIRYSEDVTDTTTDSPVDSVTESDGTEGTDTDDGAEVGGGDAGGSGDFMTDVRSNILTEGVGQATMDKFTDLSLIETDTIGIGTGPVDYFYSAEYDVTIKYERNSDTILAINDSQGTAF